MSASHLLDSPRKTLILGRSDLLGQPLYNYLCSPALNWPSVQLWGRQEIKTWQEGDLPRLKQTEQNSPIIADNHSPREELTARRPLSAQLIISATGSPFLISAQDIQPNTALIDVGEPQPDINPDVIGKASFLTPVPGGVGPLTVISLLENAFFLATH